MKKEVKERKMKMKKGVKERKKKVINAMTKNKVLMNKKEGMK